MAKDQGSMTSSPIHTIPVGGSEPLHYASLRCWCHPLAETDGMVVVHNAKDTREKFERQGIMHPERQWVLVLEDTKIFFIHKT
jgi:hypothetical protein